MGEWTYGGGWSTGDGRDPDVMERLQRRKGYGFALGADGVVVVLHGLVLGDEDTLTCSLAQARENAQRIGADPASVFLLPLAEAHARYDWVIRSYYHVKELRMRALDGAEDGDETEGWEGGAE